MKFQQLYRTDPSSGVYFSHSQTFLSVYFRTLLIYQVSLFFFSQYILCIYIQAHLYSSWTLSGSYLNWVGWLLGNSELDCLILSWLVGICFSFLLIGLMPLWTVWSFWRENLFSLCWCICLLPFSDPNHWETSTFNLLYFLFTVNEIMILGDFISPDLKLGESLMIRVPLLREKMGIGIIDYLCQCGLHSASNTSHMIWGEGKIFLCLLFLAIIKLDLTSNPKTGAF